MIVKYQQADNPPTTYGQTTQNATCIDVNMC